MALRGFRQRCYPAPECETLLRQTIGCCRLVYNKALHDRSAAWVTGKKSIGYPAQSAALTAWKKTPTLTFLNEVSCVPLQQALRHLQQAFQCFFKKKAKYPTFKRKSNGGSAEFTRSSFRWNGETRELILAKTETPLAIRWTRNLPSNAEPSTVTISLDASGRWFVALLFEDDRIQPLPQLETAIALDVGITSLITLSTGKKIRNPRYDERTRYRKRKLSRDLARKQKGSQNRHKARMKLARHHAQVADKRCDRIHKLTTRLVRENQVIVIENLSIQNMLHNCSLARVISDAGWGMIFSQLTYKSVWYGRDLIKVDRFYPSSKTCSCCGYVLRNLPLGVRHWTCPACKAEHDRDTNAARNLLAAGLAVSACGSDVSQRALRNALRLGLKQELSSVTAGIPVL